MLKQHAIIRLLSEPDDDFTGGEFVLTQSRPQFIDLKKGDGLILAVNQRPVKVLRGYYRVTLRESPAPWKTAYPWKHLSRRVMTP